MDVTNDRFHQNHSAITQDSDQLLDVRQAAALLCVKPKTLYAWVSRKQIPHRKLNSLVRFHRGELIEWTKAVMVQ